MNAYPGNEKKWVNNKQSDRVQDSYEEQKFWMTRLYWVGIRLNQFYINK